MTRKLRRRRFHERLISSYWAWRAAGLSILQSMLAAWNATASSPRR
jgi:hypothetical protein